jgi:hypothetical protein
MNIASLNMDMQLPLK